MPNFTSYFGFIVISSYLCTMETVFDYNITPEECQRIGILDKEFYLKYYTEDDANMDLAYLFYIRNEKKKASKYADKLPLDMKNDFWRTVTHP